MTIAEVLKAIREELHFSQEQFARELSISFTTVNRWENGRSVPSPLATMRLLEFCTTKGISQGLMDEIKRGYNSIKV